MGRTSPTSWQCNVCTARGITHGGLRDFNRFSHPIVSGGRDAESVECCVSRFPGRNVRTWAQQKTAAPTRKNCFPRREGGRRDKRSGRVQEIIRKIRKVTSRDASLRRRRLLGSRAAAATKVKRIKGGDEISGTDVSGTRLMEKVVCHSTRTNYSFFY